MYCVSICVVMGVHLSACVALLDFTIPCLSLHVQIRASLLETYKQVKPPSSSRVVCVSTAVWVALNATNNQLAFQCSD